MDRSRFSKGKEQISELAAATIETGKNFLSDSLARGKSAAANAGAAAVVTAVFAKEAGARAAARGLEALVSDKELEPSKIAKIIELVPFVRAGKAYAQAWNNFHTATASGDLEGIQNAKAACIVAFQEAGLDVGLYAAARVGRLARLAARTTTALSAATRVFGPLESAKDASTLYIARKLLSIDRIDNFTGRFLASIQPRTANIAAALTEPDSKVKES